MHSYLNLSFSNTMCLQTLHREPSEAAEVSVHGSFLPGSPGASGCSGAGREEGLSPGHGPAAPGSSAIPPGAPDPLLADTGEHHPKTVHRSGAPLGALLPSQTTLSRGRPPSLTGNRKTRPSLYRLLPIH